MKLMKHFVVLLVAIIIFGGGGGAGVVLCNRDSTKLNLCRAAVTGRNPPQPSQACCAVVRHVNLPCLCKYRSVLPSLGIDPKNALALPSKCGLRSTECPGK